MNKRIYSLVFFVLYILLTVSIHCSEHKASSVRDFFRVTKKTNKSKGKNDIEFKCETQLNNNNNKNDTYYNKQPVEDHCCYCICPCYMIGVLINNMIKSPISIFKF
ncbi:fam-c protein [Plasmodium chabaudi chabaudi]|uniref:Fam-c protein n=1 Tax=Plasmodium chabaudi chabaudi TaxID=31271 RepID=A0A1C6WR02_PLACU|nr:fam-c protein [Plasmodium chabaudi chabaudi]SCL88520.1 fam-c protein [Plasmodium chabaudi chabaudi]SCL91661.1 fam-c protein [Plasmodium chabaudi chabaudi]VTZ68188.1 fam-c protein [Plasmodium chabaudi chabaudi]